MARPYIVIRDRIVERKLSLLGEEALFSLIYHTGYWKGLGIGSRSGEGSSISATETIRRTLPAMIKALEIGSMLDLPCGDWHWMSKVDLGEIDYIGADIVDDLIRDNRRKYGSHNRRFVKLDITRDELPRSELIFVRDCLVHLKEDQILAAVRNVISSGSKYFATTTFSNVLFNSEPKTADRWRPLDLTLPPFNFPHPIFMLDDRSTISSHDAGKYIGVWLIDDLLQFFLNDQANVDQQLNNQS